MLIHTSLWLIMLAQPTNKDNGSEPRGPVRIAAPRRRMWMRVWWWLAARLKSLLQRLPYMNRSFLVMSSARSGSTLLMQYLRSHPSIDCQFQEPLNREVLIKHNLIRAKADMLNYFMAQLLPHKPWIPYTACKVFGEQLEYSGLSLGDLLCALRDPPVVVLYRENMLETFVSLQIAFQTGVWFSEEDSKDHSQVTVDWEKFKVYAEEERQRWRKSLRDLTMTTKVHFLSYEELSSDHNTSLAEIFSFLSLPHCEVVAFSKKQNPLSLQKKVSNFDDIKDEMRIFPFLLTKEWMQDCISQ